MNFFKKNIYRLRNLSLSISAHFIVSIIFIIKKVQAKNYANKKLLLVRTDAIGDYVLFRNFIETLINSDQYSGYNFYLLGNIAFKSLALTYDNKYFKNCIWINTKKFWEKKLYRKILILKLILHNFEILINPTYSRNYFIDENLIAQLNCKTKIAFKGDNVNYNTNNQISPNKIYHTLIPSDPAIKFEFERNKEFFSKLLNTNVTLEKPKIHVDSISDFLIKYKSCIVIFPGASQKKKIWDSTNFSVVVNHILQTNNTVLIAGSNDDKIHAQRILSFVGSNTRLIDLSGKTSLPQLTELLSISKLLISNDTVAVHLAAAVGCKVITVLNGQHYGRFSPYPNENLVKSFYPPQFKSFSKEDIEGKYRYESTLNINEISPSEIINAIDKININ